MTLDEIKERIEKIRAMAGDDEVAHGAEDDLRRDFIRYVARIGMPSLAEKASVVLSTDEIEFERWCA